MKVSARCDYACKALLELALHWPNKGPVRIHHISERQGIPVKYLVQILIQLKRMGLIESVRGRQGGYTLAASPEKISLGEVMRQIGGPVLQISAAASKNGSLFADIWREASEGISKVLDSVTFAQIAEKTKEMNKTVIYQI